MTVGPGDEPDENTHAALLAAEHARHGCWPVAGGWLDQTQWCTEAVRFVNAELEIWKARAARRP